MAHEGDAEGTHISVKKARPTSSALGVWELKTLHILELLWNCLRPGTLLPTLSLTGHSCEAPCQGRSTRRLRSGPGTGPFGWSPANLPQ